LPDEDEEEGLGFHVADATVLETTPEVVLLVVLDSVRALVKPTESTLAREPYAEEAEGGLEERLLSTFGGEPIEILGAVSEVEVDVNGLRSS
jgi:hypothetical protein